MKFGLMFFSSLTAETPGEYYEFMKAAARFADDAGLSSVWLPERHFHEFGGVFPNPSLAAAVLAGVTRRIELRAGSIVSPLHDAVRIAEEWSVVDNLSGGRVALSFGSGWNANDFIFYPERYAVRREIMYQQINDVRALWRGETVSRRNGAGRDVEVSLFPRPVQPELPLWITSSGDERTFEKAGEIGANILTHLLGQDLSELERKIGLYRAARARAGHLPACGRVCVMIHTFVCEDTTTIERHVKAAFKNYLKSAIGLEKLAGEGGGVISGGHRTEAVAITPARVKELLELAYRKYYERASLIGGADKCREMVAALAGAGVTEAACLVDFIGDCARTLEALPALSQLVEEFSSAAAERRAVSLVSDFMS